MTNEMKEKIIECLTVHKEHGGGYFLLSNEKISELLAIIDEGIEKEIFHWKQSEMDDIAEKF